MNSWFNAILWLNLVVSCLGLLGLFVNMMKGDNVFDIFTLINACAVCVAIAGFYWLLKAEKKGFYLFVIGCLLNATIAYIQFCYVNAADLGAMRSVASGIVFKGVWASLGKIVLFMLLMLLKCDGKNAYHVLWSTTQQDEDTEE